MNQRKSFIALGVCCLFLAVPWPGAADGGPSKVKEFVVMGYQGIVQDLSAGKGSYLTSLIELLNVPPEKSTATIEQLKSLQQRYPNIMEFADQVAALQIENPSPPVPFPALPALPTDRRLYSGDSLKNALQHLTRGMNVTVYLQNGSTIQGRVAEYDSGRLMVRMPGGKSKSCRLPDIRALEAPEL